MQRIAESELILNARGAVYHLDLRPEELASTIITVGDPERVGVVSKYFDEIEYRSQHREFVTHTGWVGKKKISVVSTGIGTDNIDIVLNELDALLNIDFESRTIKPALSHLDIVRIGTSGSLQDDIPVDGFVASTHGLGIDNLLNFYRHEQNDERKTITSIFHNPNPVTPSSFSSLYQRCKPFNNEVFCKRILPGHHRHLSRLLWTAGKDTQTGIESSRSYQPSDPVSIRTSPHYQFRNGNCRHLWA